MQLATLRPNGSPANRTVVFRGFLDTADDLTFVTDRRSNKISEIAFNPLCEVCWYFPESREQYRFSGKMTVVGEAHPSPELASARQRAWAKMSDAGRAQFTWPHPGQPRTDLDTPLSTTTPLAGEPAVEDFCLVVINVTEVDILQLGKNRRSEFVREEGADGSVLWKETEVNP